MRGRALVWEDEAELARESKKPSMLGGQRGTSEGETCKAAASIPVSVGLQPRGWR